MPAPNSRPGARSAKRETWSGRTGVADGLRCRSRNLTTCTCPSPCRLRSRRVCLCGGADPGRLAARHRPARNRGAQPRWRAGPSAMLIATRDDGRIVTAPLTIAPRAWRIEHVAVGARSGAVPSELFARRRAIELERINAARLIVSGSQGWRHAVRCPRRRGGDPCRSQPLHDRGQPADDRSRQWPQLCVPAQFGVGGARGRDRAARAIHRPDRRDRARHRAAPPQVAQVARRAARPDPLHRTDGLAQKRREQAPIREQLKLNVENISPGVMKMHHRDGHGFPAVSASSPGWRAKCHITATPSPIIAAKRI